MCPSPVSLSLPESLVELELETRDYAVPIRREWDPSRMDELLMLGMETNMLGMETSQDTTAEKRRLQEEHAAKMKAQVEAGAEKKVILEAQKKKEQAEQELAQKMIAQQEELAEMNRKLEEERAAQAKNIEDDIAALNSTPQAKLNLTFFKEASLCKVPKAENLISQGAIVDGYKKAGRAALVTCIIGERGKVKVRKEYKDTIAMLLRNKADVDLKDGPEAKDSWYSRWQRMGAAEPTKGRLLSGPLAKALETSSEFNKVTFATFSISDLGLHDYIESHTEEIAGLSTISNRYQDSFIKPGPCYWKPADVCALLEATRSSHEEIVQMILQHKTSESIKTADVGIFVMGGDGSNALDLAVEKVSKCMHTNSLIHSLYRW